MKMVGKDIDPSDIGKHPKIIKAAQKDMTQSDVLVCGKCHGVFHFIDLFKEHKENGCDKESYLKDLRDTKPKLWAFLLWKSSQLNNNNNINSSLNHINSWNLYQQWIRMDESLRETWIVAGKTILSFAKLGQGILQEMPVKITKTVVDNAQNKNVPLSQQTNKFTTSTRQQQQQADKQQPVQQVIMKKDVGVKDDPDDPSPIKTITTEQPKVVRKTAGTPISQGAVNKSLTTTASTTTVFAKNINRRANRTIPNTNGQEFEEETVEKIIAKRFNPRRKMHEFLVKWEGFPHDQNTWEPQTHLESCPQLLETFEKQLARQKEQRAKQAAANAQQQQQQQQQSTVSSPISPNKTMNRATPTTTVTKIIKPIDQGKKLPDDEEMNTVSGIGTGGTIKRKLEETDFENDFDDDDIPTHTVKKVKNGAAVTVKTDSKIETKVISQQSKPMIRAVNGTAKLSSTPNDASTSSADIVITKDPSQNSGIFKKSGLVPITTSKTEAQIRVLSKGENTTSGIVRINSSTSQQSNNTTISAGQKLSSTGTIVTSLTNATHQTPSTTRITQQRVGTPTSSTNSAQISQVQTHRIVMTPKETQMMKTPTTPTTVQTRIIPKTSPVSAATSTLNATSGGGVYQSRTTTTVAGGATTIHRTSLSPQTNQSPTSGKMIINRNVKNTPAPRNVSPAITPEQKIIQLSKSGDLKVTRKVITQPISQTSPQLQQQQQQQQQHHTSISSQQRHHVLQQQHQQLRTTSLSKSESEHSQSPIPSESLNDSQNSAGQFTLCEVTGKVLRPGEEAEQQKVSESEAHEEKQQQQSDEVLQVQMSADPQAAEAFAAGDLALATEDGTHQFLANEDGTPLLVTGEDGTIYQVAGKNADGQTILIAQGADGEQQFAYVAAEDGEEGVLALDNAMAEAVAQMLPKQQAEALAAAAAAGNETQFIIKQTDDGTADVAAAVAAQRIGQTTTEDVTQGLTIQTGDAGDSQDGNIPAEVVQADLPSPGGTRRVVLLLQDGTFMMTEMHDDEYQALNLVS